jgi:hypothetical protein
MLYENTVAPATLGLLKELMRQPSDCAKTHPKPERTAENP